MKINYNLVYFIFANVFGGMILFGLRIGVSFFNGCSSFFKKRK